MFEKKLQRLNLFLRFNCAAPPKGSEKHPGFAEANPPEAVCILGRLRSRPLPKGAFHRAGSAVAFTATFVAVETGADNDL